jgi:predicted permease
VGRARLARRSLVESLVFALLGGAAGVLVAQWGGLAIRRLLITTEGASLDVLTDWRTLALSLALAIVCAVLTGIAPSFVMQWGDVARALRGGSRGGVRGRSRLRAALLVTQAALSVVLLVGAGLFVRSLLHVRALPLGYDATRVLLTRLDLRGTRLDDEARTRLERELLRTAQETPGVVAAARVMTAPLLATNSTALFVPGIDSVERLGYFTYQASSADYFRVMGTRVLRGRGLLPMDDASHPPVAVVGEEMARTLWPGRDAIGQCLRVFEATRPCTTVVGIAEDIVQQDLTASQRLHYYLSVDQFAPSGGDMLLVRTRGDPNAMRETLRAALQRAAPGEAFITVQPLADVTTAAQRSWRLGATLFAAFGALALIVAAIGLYGVVGYDIAQRAHELGVRVALGARSHHLVALVLGHGARLAGLGVAIGLAVAWLASGWLEPLLFKQPARDPLIYAGVAAVMLMTALIASASPSWRASRADPNRALRSE